MEYFTLSEFKCKCGKCDGGVMDSAFLAKLDKARGLAKVPFNITSGYRCITHNRKIGSKDNSAHVKGKAADIKIKSSRDAFKILKALIDVGFNRIGYNSNSLFFHVDSDESLPPNVFFDY